LELLALEIREVLHQILVQSFVKEQDLHALGLGLFEKGTLGDLGCGLLL
jgi:hypothetical protein